MASGFLAGLGDELARRGRAVHRINFNGGDWLFWRRSGAKNFRGRLNAWPAFLSRQLDAWRITDIILFGDARPLHAVAIEVARLNGVRVHVVEEGYIRPNCITVEEDGVNGHSTLPREADAYLRLAEPLPAWNKGRPVTNVFPRRAWEDVAYNLASLVLSPLYPGYRTHRPWHPLMEYAGWIGRLVTQKRDRKRSQTKLAGLTAQPSRYFLFPLQLDGDTQIRFHSPFKGVRPSIELVIRSFARQAPADAVLVIKEHPLDNRLIGWSRIVQRVAQDEGVPSRVVFLEDAPLEQVLGGAAAVVTVNSTVGVLALAMALPVKTLGTAIYDLPGLTFPGDLDDFWSGGAPPDPELFDAFRRVVMDRTQVNGSFFSREGLQLAVVGAADKLEREPDPELQSARSRSRTSLPAAACEPA